MKYLKYFGIILAVALMIYTKNKMDQRTKNDVKAMDEMEQDEGLSTPVPKKK